MLEILSIYLYYLRTVENIEKITEKGYICDLNLFFRFVKHRDYKTTTQEDILKYLEHLKKQNLAPSTIKKKITILKGLYNWLVLQEKIPISPFQKIRIKNHIKPSKIKKVFTDQEIKNLLTPEEDIINMGFKKIQDEVIIRVLLATGIRRKELLGIRISDLNLEGKTIHLRDTKTKRERIVYFDATTKWWIERYLIRRMTFETRQDYLFINRTRRVVDVNELRRVIDGKLRKAKLKSKGVGAHSFRHTFATKFLERGGSIKALQELLGHSDIKTTLGVYSHPSREFIEREYKRTREDQETPQTPKEFDRDLL